MDEEEDGGAESGPRQSIPCGPDDRLVIPFQNENIYAYIKSPNGEKKVRDPPCSPLYIRSLPGHSPRAIVVVV